MPDYSPTKGITQGSVPTATPGAPILARNSHAERPIILGRPFGKELVLRETPTLQALGYISEFLSSLSQHAVRPV